MSVRGDIIEATAQIVRAHEKITGADTPLAEAAMYNLKADAIDLVRAMLRVNGFRERLTAALSEPGIEPKKHA